MTTTTTTNFAYDKSRRLTTQYSSAEAHYYTYNQRNMVTQVQDVKTTSPDANRYFTYNALGERVYGVDGTASPSYWAYDGGKVKSERVGSGMAFYQHNDTPFDRLGSVVEHISNDLATCYLAFKDDGSVTRLKNTSTQSSDTYECSRNGVVLGSATGIGGNPTSGRLQTLSPLLLASIAASQQMNLAAYGALYLAAQAMFCAHIIDLRHLVKAILLDWLEDQILKATDPYAYIDKVGRKQGREVSGRVREHAQPACEVYWMSIDVDPTHQFPMNEFGILPQVPRSNSRSFFFAQRVTTIGNNLKRCFCVQSFTYNDVTAYDLQSGTEITVGKSGRFFEAGFGAGADVALPTAMTGNAQEDLTDDAWFFENDEWDVHWIPQTFGPLPSKMVPNGIGGQVEVVPKVAFTKQIQTKVFGLVAGLVAWKDWSYRWDNATARGDIMNVGAIGAGTKYARKDATPAFGPTSGLNGTEFLPGGK